MYYALLILLLLVLLAVIFCCIRRKQMICKIRCMEPCDKCSLLTELAEPFGYDYMTPRFNMVFDALPVYFDYQEKTLLKFHSGTGG